MLKIGINLNSRTTIASLIYEGERRLRELLHIDHVVILVLDKEQEVLVKLNQERAALESEINAMS
jgi:hypothetical protein